MTRRARFCVTSGALLLCIGFTMALEPYANYKEGTCADLRIHPIPLNDHQRLLFDEMPFSPAGSRYIMYRYGAGHPNYADLRVDEFYYDWCFLRNISTTTGSGATSTWGRPFGEFGVRTIKGRPDVYLDSFSRTARNSDQYTRLYVTLTDNRSWAVVVACWNNENTTSWHVISNTPTLSKDTLELIENHAEAFGFPRQNFVRVRYDTCKRMSDQSS